MATDPTSSATQPADVASIGAANDSVFQFQPKPVRVLFLNEGAEQVFRQNQQLKNDELWIGTAYDPHDPNADDISVYIRIADPMPVVAELLCSVIGRALGLPVPEPFMVSIHPGCLPGSKLLPSTTTSMAFASLNVGGTSFSQLLRSGESSKAMLRAWEHLIPVATFDEWMANSDRNLSNILFVSNALWIIDHAEAFHGRARELYSLAELTESSITNALGTILNEFSLVDRSLHLEKVLIWVRDAAAHLSVTEAVSCADIKRWQTAEQQAMLIEFITCRLIVTHKLLCSRLGHPQLPPQ